jgi:hypothetical protein
MGKVRSKKSPTGKSGVSVGNYSSSNMDGKRHDEIP